MRIYILLLIFTIVTSSCSFNKKETLLIKVLDQFDTQLENDHLGVNILTHQYHVGLKKAIPDISSEIIQNLELEKFTRSDNNEISIRLIVSNKARNLKDKLKAFYSESINSQVRNQVRLRKTFTAAEKWCKNISVELDRKNPKAFMNGLSAKLIQSTKEKDVEKMCFGKRNFDEVKPDRSMFYSQYYKSLPGVEEEDILLICFKFKHSGKYAEQYALTFKNEAFEVVGYEFWDNLKLSTSAYFNTEKK